MDEPIPHLVEALTHPSFTNEDKRLPPRHYQRLEFLGDAVLELAVSALLVAKFSQATEGQLTLMRSRLVRTEALARWARSVDLGQHVRLGRGAAAAGERDQDSVLADAAEALVGAIFVDLGFERAREVAELIVAEPLAELADGAALDPKSELQERIQAEGRKAPTYRTVAAEGPDHQRSFVIEVVADGTVLATGTGRSKKAAEREAARLALEAMTRET